MIPVVFAPVEEKTVRRPDNEHMEAAMEIAKKMIDEELAAMLMGEISKGQDNMKVNELVETGIFVPGAVGETSCRFEEKYGVTAISMAAANHKELLTDVLRGEWDFKGIVMTDWTTTTAGSAVSHQCAEAGNDLIMPGNQRDVEDILTALSNGSMDREKAVDCAARLITILFDTIGMENPKPYRRIVE